MAGNKINTKGKGKDEKGKSSKTFTQNREDSDVDFSLLRRPVQSSVTGFAQARKIFDVATDELRGLLTNECDILYECKTCRNIFRSLVNFVSHKRMYCNEKYDKSVHSHFFKTNSVASELSKIKSIEEVYQESLKNKRDDKESIDDPDDPIPITKDLTSVIEMLTKTKGVFNVNSDQLVTLQKIPNSSVAMFQNVDLCDEKSDDMKAQIKEINNILSRDKAVLQSDGKFKTCSSVPLDNYDSDNVIQISDDDEMDGCNLKCKICDLQFSTVKTLKFHMKYKHLESRLVYPCPDCLEIFSTSWSVYRHLFKVHRKTAAQIRRLRESIQSKAFRMNNPPAYYEKRKNNMKPAVAQKITEEERLDQENQAWMDNMEGDGEVPRCGGCGRTFERRAALAAHTHTCQSRTRALNALSRPHTHRPDKKIEIQIRKDYNKPQQQSAYNFLSNNEASEIKTSNDPTPEIEKPKAPKQAENEKPNEEKLKGEPVDIVEDEEKSNEALESPEKDAPPVDNCRAILKLPFAHQAEKNNLAALKQRAQTDIELDKLLCKRCDTKHKTAQELYDHVAKHYKWIRYACKLCNFKHYDFEKLPEHVKVVHKLKGDTDFYFSTLKAVNGSEALELAEVLEEQNEVEESSPESRRQSRCSSDSSRLSDDSSSSSTRVEAGSRKRKMLKMQNKQNAKKKKAAVVNDDGEDSADSSVVRTVDKAMREILGVSDCATIKSFEDNSSDLDDIDDKINKRNSVDISVASSRPVRKKTKRKNEDFEYDLSNLLKLEAQGYRDSQSVTIPKPPITKKKIQQELQSSYNSANKDCCGAMVQLAKQAVDIAAAHMKVSSYLTIWKPVKEHPSNIFAKPMTPKTFARTEKMSPSKKEILNPDETKDNLSSNKQSKTNNQTLSEAVEVNSDKPEIKVANIPKIKVTNMQEEVPKTVIDQKDETKVPEKVEKAKLNLNIPSVLPLKLGRQSIEVMKNPLINKNITDFTKAGMKTKILVIKPIHRKKDGMQALNAPLQYQTIKLKDPNKCSSSTEENSSDQVVLVKVPKVDRAISLSSSDSKHSNEKQIPIVSNTASEVKDTTDTVFIDETVEDKDKNSLQNNMDTSKEVSTVEQAQPNVINNVRANHGADDRIPKRALAADSEVFNESNKSVDIAPNIETKDSPT